MPFQTETSAGGIVYKILPTTDNRQPTTLWLITQHSQNKGWGFPKGLVGDKVRNESMDIAALREVEEEGGVRAKMISKLKEPVSYMYTFQKTLIKKTVHYFLMEYISGDPKNHDWEMMDAKFVTAEEVEKTLTYKSDKEAFAAALSYKITEEKKGK